MPTKVIFSNTNKVKNKSKGYRTAHTLTILLGLFVVPSLLYSFMSLFPIDDGPYKGTQLTGVTLHWIFGTTLIITTATSFVLNLLLINYQKYKLAILISLLPLIHILLISYAWSLMRV